MKRLNHVKQANKAFNKNEQNIGISRENQILLSKLVEVSSGKLSSIPKLPNISRSKIGKNTSSTAQTSTFSTGEYRPTSLNLHVRQKETLRVESENHAFARRLFESKPIIKKAEFDKEFHNQKMFKRNLRKVPKSNGKLMSNRSASVATLRGMAAQKMSTKNLPPLDDESLTKLAQSAAPHSTDQIQYGNESDYKDSEIKKAEF